MLRFHALQVLEVRPEAEDAICVTLDVPAALRETFTAAAGQHVVLRARVDGGEVRRTYSLLDAAGAFPLRLGVRIHPQGRLSRFLATRLLPGDTLEVMPPNGSFGPAVPIAGTYVAFAAGCGITPVLSIVRTLLARSADCQVSLFYGNRTGARTMFLEELQGLKDRHPDRLALHFLMSREPQDIALLNGRLDADKIRTICRELLEPSSVSEYFLCGPGTMIEDVTDALRALDVDPGRIRAERFGIATGPTGAAGEDSRAAAQEGITQVVVNIDGRRRVFTMRTGAETVLEAAARAGLELPFSCRAGVCSTCRTRLVRGAVQMAQNYALEDWETEQGFVLACQSRATTSAIELDYDER